MAQALERFATPFPEHSGSGQGIGSKTGRSPGGKDMNDKNGTFTRINPIQRIRRDEPSWFLLSIVQLK